MRLFLYLIALFLAACGQSQGERDLEESKIALKERRVEKVFHDNKKEVLEKPADTEKTKEADDKMGRIKAACIQLSHTDKTEIVKRTALLLEAGIKPAIIEPINNIIDIIFSSNIPDPQGGCAELITKWAGADSIPHEPQPLNATQQQHPPAVHREPEKPITPDSPTARADTVKDCVTLERPDTSVLSANNVYVELGWKFDISNTCATPFALRAKFSIYDTSDFLLDSAQKNILLPAFGKETISDKMLVSPLEKARRIHKSGASVEQR